MNIIITGPQGSGKGTQAKILAEKLNLFHQENGKMLRDMANDDERIDKMLKKGELVPDLEMIELMEKNLTNRNIGFDNIIFDGYPRTVSQYEELKKWLDRKGKKIDYAIVLHISETETVKRLSARRIHSKTGEIYSLLMDLPDDVNKADLVQRDDDKEEAIKLRLNLYNEKTKPLIKLYKKDGILIEIDGEQSIDTITTEILKKMTSSADFKSVVSSSS